MKFSRDAAHFPKNQTNITNLNPPVAPRSRPATVNPLGPNPMNPDLPTITQHPPDQTKPATRPPYKVCGGGSGRWEYGGRFAEDVVPLHHHDRYK